MSAETVLRRELDATRGPAPALEATAAAQHGPVASAGLDVTTAPSVRLDATTAPSVRLEGTRSAASEPSATGSEPALVRGALIGRYVVLDRLGAGAMGVVFAAFDPELDRKVAIKLLRPEFADASFSASSDARARLIREAQALARLNHPNVVAIFDVGTHDDQVWIAMELVEGRTLRSWLAERPRDWREVLAVMQAAGRGLAAAHTAGLVHRDIKPDNVMIGDDGRVRMMDFGLARRDTVRADAARPGSGAPGRAMLAVDVTQAGAMVGTPAYMAPEQFRGDNVGPPADVFAFCVMLWEGLHGARPFAGATVAELRANVEAGRIAAPTRARRAPRWIDAILQRGLAAAPGQRWPTMTATLAELERGQTRTRRRRALALAGGLAAAAAGVQGGFAVAHQRTLTACAAEGAAIADDWSTTTRAGLERAFAATGKANATTALAMTTPWLDRWTESWQSARTQVCVAHRLEGSFDDELHARALDCLDEHRGTFLALLRELERADALMLTRATPAAAGLPGVADCTDPAALRQRPPPSPARRAELMVIRGQLARASSLVSAGRFKDGVAVAKDAAAAASAAGWPPLIAEAEQRLGHLEALFGDYPVAEQTLLRAVASARDARAPRPAAVSMTMLVAVVGDRGTRFAEGKVWAEAARTELTHVAGDVRPLQAQLDNNLALVFHAERADAEAQRLHERALATWIEVYGEEHPQVALSLNNLANTYSGRGAYEEALRLHERALAIRERTLGPDHPFVAGSLSNLALAHGRLGHAGEVQPLHERALAIRERALDPTHPDVVESLNNLAGMHHARGAYEVALPLYERALAAIDAAPGGDASMRATLLFNCGLIHEARCRDTDAIRDLARALDTFEKALGKDHPTLAYPLTGLVGVRLRLGELDEALRLAERGLAIREAALGKDHPEILWSLIALAAVQRERGDLAEALRFDTRALALAEATRGKDHPELAAVLVELGSTLVALRRPAEAIAGAERALTLVPPDDRTSNRSKVRFVLARALWDAGVDRPRARALAEQADRDLAAAGGCEREVQQIRDWLAAR